MSVQSPVGKYICFAGIDGIGKSTQAGRLAKYLRDQGKFCYLQEGKEEFCVNVVRQLAVLHRSQPRQVLSNEEFDIAKAFDTLRDYAEVVLPIVKRGGYVVAPRSSYCRVALARALGTTNVDKVSVISHFYGEPDHVIYLTAPVDIAVERILKRGADDEDPRVLRQFKEQLDLTARAQAWPTIDASRDPDTVFQDVLEVARRFLITGGT